MCETVKAIIKKKPKPGCSMGELSPFLLSQWNYDKNGRLSPFEITLNYSKKVWWKCEKGHEWENTPNSRNSNKNGCPYCSGRYATRENNLRVLYPEIAKEWHRAKNETIEPEHILPKSHKKSWWICDKGHEWEQSIATRTSSNSKCPYCTGARVSETYNLPAIRPDIMKYWDYERNLGINPSELLPYATVMVAWKCEKNHKWETSPNQFSSCLYCLNRKVDENNSLHSLHPQLCLEWHPQKNIDLTPSDVVPGSAMKVWWRCTKCEHEWEASIRNRTERGTNCPECARWIGTSFAEQSLFYYLKKVFPSIQNRYKFQAGKKKTEVDIYIPELNIGIEYDGYYYHKNKRKRCLDLEKDELLKDRVKLIRIRENGLKPLQTNASIIYNRRNNHKTSLHEMIQFIIDHLISSNAISSNQKHELSLLSIDVLRDSKEIYELMNINEISNSVAHKHPHILPYWDQDKNGKLTLQQFKASNDTLVHWKCQQGHQWQEAINKVASRKQYVCPTCNSFGHHHPEELKRWDYTKNIGTDPFLISKRSSQKYWWKCEEGHSYERTIDTLLKSKGCPFCHNKWLNNENSLQYTHPELAKQWHPTRNGELRPTDVLCGTKRSIWWKCEKGHEWERPVYARIKGERISHCPYCINLFMSQESSLENAVKLGEASEKLLTEWNFEKNTDITPSTIGKGSSKKVHWKCEHGHEWQAQVLLRVKGTGNCISCNSFGFHYPELLTEWDYEKNIGIDPMKVSKNSNIMYWWKCEHGHSYPYRVSNKVRGYGKCPTCQSIGFKHPELLVEWDEQKNTGIDPFQISAGNDNIKVHWKCKEGHEWVAVPYARSRGTNRCKACNSLGYKNPELAKEFHPIKNNGMNVMDISFSSGMKVWWKCKEGHEWQATVAHRKNGTGCVHCYKEQLSKKKEE